jgi:hypothetical protein|tara:strand:- start:7346 stop:7534 length:189 start_codon:yes stop_codon:yes gene_type:complete
MKLRQCEICKCYLTDGEVNASQYDRYLTCFQHKYEIKEQTASLDKQEMKLMDWVDLGRKDND